MSQDRAGDLFDGESEILRQLEQAYLTGYPNPQRIGCPGPVLIEQIVTGQNRPPAGSEIVQHLTHCSPCFKIFIAERNRLRAQRRRSLRTRFIAVAATVILVVVTGGAGLWQRFRSWSSPPVLVHQPGSADTVASIRLDLQSYSIERGAAGPNRSSNIVGPTLPRKNVNLTLALPVGFEDGQYDIRVSHTEDGPAILESRGSARLIDNTVQLSTTLDFSGVSPGPYFLGMRETGLSWAHVQILVR